MDGIPFWREPLHKLLQDLGASPAGLDRDDAGRRLILHGPNDTAVSGEAPAWRRFLGRFGNPLVIILLAASLVSAATGDVASFVIVTIIVMMSVTMDFTQEVRAKKAIDALRNKVALRCQAIRGGEKAEIPAREVVPGDILLLAAGDLVPADGRLLSACDFYVNQALLTGEPYPVEKRGMDPPPASDRLSDAVNAAFAGTSVISGSATLLVCRTGTATILGKVAASLVTRIPPTAFEAGIRQFGMLLLRITMVLVLFVLTESIMFQRPWLESLLFSVALAVGLTPELLPMILTVTLTHGAVRLARKRVVIKRLPAIHNLGAMDVLCTDKTGTLTEARIEVIRHLDPQGQKSERVFELGYLNSYFETGLRNTLDEAILEHGKVDVGRYRKLDEVPFDFERRRVSVLIEADSVPLLLVKGAPEDILGLSTHFDEGDAERLMTEEKRAELLARFEQFGASGFRALAIAYRREPRDQETAIVSDETDLTFAGYILFLDPPKSSAAQAVRQLAASGIAVKILTGDNERVASFLCKQLGFPVTGAITGEELSAMSDEALLGSLPRLNLFCRLTPQEKLRVLNALKHSGQTVGFLGDGINDASALRAADVGISVDNGADVAKAAADIILLEKDLTVVQDGVAEGRRTVINVDKYILMASSANFGNIMSMALAGLILPFLPLLPIQVLLTNLIYDFAQTGLPFDHVDPEVIERPVHWNIRLIEYFMLAMGPVSTVFDLLTFAVMILILHADMAQFRTGWFIESLITQILMIFAVRTHRHLFQSRPHPIVLALALGTSVLTVALPFLPVGTWFDFSIPDMPYLVFLVMAVPGFLVTIEWIKRLFYARMAKSISIAAMRRPPP